MRVHAIFAGDSTLKLEYNAWRPRRDLRAANATKQFIRLHDGLLARGDAAPLPPCKNS